MQLNALILTKYHSLVTKKCKNTTSQKGRSMNSWVDAFNVGFLSKNIGDSLRVGETLTVIEFLEIDEKCKYNLFLWWHRCWLL